MFTRLRAAPDAAFGGWLMPVVPPMVSAATGALLIPHLPAGQPRLTLLLACYAMFGISLIASMVVITQLWQRLVRHSIGPAAMVPTLWIVLGPLGQSITAAGLLGAAARLVLPSPYGPAFQAFGVVYGVPVWGFAVLWAALATAITIRAARARLPFTLTWWSFTFPVGTLVTGTTSLALHTGDGAVPLGRGRPVPGPGGRLGRGQRAHRRGHLAGQRAARAPPAAPPDGPGLRADEVAALTRTGEGIASRLPRLEPGRRRGAQGISRGGRVAAGIGGHAGGRAAGSWRRGCARLAVVVAGPGRWPGPGAGAGRGRAEGLARVLAVSLAAVTLVLPAAGPRPGLRRRRLQAPQDTPRAPS